jgi:hypothetical protein
MCNGLTNEELEVIDQINEEKMKEILQVGDIADAGEITEPKEEPLTTLLDIADAGEIVEPDVTGTIKVEEEIKTGKVAEPEDEGQPFNLPNMAQIFAQVDTFGHKKLVGLLLAEVAYAYNARMALDEFGYKQNKNGKWITK